MTDLPVGARDVAGARPMVMVVDSDSHARTNMAALLRQHDFTVESCASAPEAIERLVAGARPDALLLELALESMDGWALRARMLEEPSWSRIPVLVVSRDTSPQARAVHAEAFFAKPADEQALLSALENVTRGAAARDPAGTLPSIAHEINNSLAYVLGTLELAEAKARELEARLRGADAFTMVGLRQLLSRAQRGADRIVSVVREFESPRREGLRSFPAPAPREPTPVWHDPLYQKERSARREGSPYLRERAPRPTVLVVDDESMICELVSDILDEEYDVVSFTDPRAALASMLNGRFDVIVCDLLMPELSGMELYEQLERQRPELTQRLLFLSGGAFTESARTFLSRVRRPQVKKPFLRSDLLDAIEEQLTPKH